MLKELVEILKVFLNDLPSTKPKLVNKITFIEAGKRPPRSKTKPTGILHLSNDWVLVADLDGGLLFPGHIAVSAQRPDIVIYSNSLKKVLLIELTCPCEENMEAWHSQKVSKYSCLVNTIRTNGWCVDMFAIEVGARGYCSRSLTLCLRRLGLSNKLAFSTARKVGQTSMKASFCIWLGRSSREWSQDLLPPSATPLVQASKDTPSLSTPIEAVVAPNIPTKPLCFVKPVAPREPTGSEKHVGLLNKGNTCYANSILQVLSVIPSLWSQSASETGDISRLTKTVSLVVSLLDRAAAPVDPSNFLRALANKFSSVRDSPFNINVQQDVSEVLQVLLDDFKGTSPLAEDIFSTTVQSTVTCDTCFCSSIKEDKLDILSLPTKKHISTSFIDLLKSQSLSGDDMWFCPQCSLKQNSTTDSIITKSGSVLILQLKRYATFQGNVFKDTKHVECLPCSNHILEIPIDQNNSISFSNRYALVATINHSGNLNAGHYWAFIKKGNSWLNAMTARCCR